MNGKQLHNYIIYHELPLLNNRIKGLDTVALDFVSLLDGVKHEEKLKNLV